MGEIDAVELLRCLVESSEKAAKIAQHFRNGDCLSLLVEEKSSIIKNKQLVQDFKTIADVLVQETIKKEIGRKFPSIIPNVQGEEENSFQNSLGETVKIELTDSPEETIQLLCRVLQDREELARSIAGVIHSPVTEYVIEHLESCPVQADNIGIWIDPIDATSEYIKGKDGDSGSHGILQYGLRCVCVLIGAYDLTTGFPLIGVINQPFHHRNDSGIWQSKCYWGINCGPIKGNSINLPESKNAKKLIVRSYCENKKLLQLMEQQYEVVDAAGAGYKSLLVTCADADLYVLAQSTTHMWDICAPHAILRSQGGGVVEFTRMCDEPHVPSCEAIEDMQMKYSPKKGLNSTRNTGGIIAYRNYQDLADFVQQIHEHDIHINIE